MTKIIYKDNSTTIMISLHLLQMCFYMRKKSIFSILCILFFQIFYSNNILKDSTLLKSSSDYIKYHPSSKEDFLQEYLGKGNKYKLPCPKIEIHPAF